MEIKLDSLYLGMEVKKEITICCSVEIESLRRHEPTDSDTIQCAWKN